MNAFSVKVKVIITASDISLIKAIETTEAKLFYMAPQLAGEAKVWFNFCGCINASIF